MTEIDVDDLDPRVQFQDLWVAMWERQAETQRFFNLNPEAMDSIAKARTAKDLALGLYEESGELSRDATRFKAHLLKHRPVERTNVADEAADVLKYTIAIAQLYGVTAEEMFQAFMRKSDVVEDRARGQRTELEVSTKLIVSDLDNCFADMRVWQAKLTEAQGGAPMNDRTVQLLESLKADMYRGGGFRNMPAIPGAVEASKAIKEMGFKLVLVTARPQWQYKRLYADTLHWLQKCGVVYDNILFEKDKAEAIYEHIFPARPRFFIEDRDKHALEVSGIGVPVLLLDYPHNRHIEETSLIKRVAGWTDIVDVISASECVDK